MQEKVTVVGAGLVGSLLSIYLAKKGKKVTIYERRPDMRMTTMSAGKSINLALSDRGWRGIAGVGITDEIKKVAIPMYGRMIHNLDGSLNFLPYGEKDQAIYSVSRGGLNSVLMDLAEASGVEIKFNERCDNIDLENAVCHFKNFETQLDQKVKSDCVYGADGAFSAARLSMQLSTDRFEYSQHYLEQGYKELHIPAGADGKFLMEKNALHIWPREKYMLIALPNIDGSFTCTLFFNFDGPVSFASLDSKEKVKKFFDEKFPDAVLLMPTLLEDFQNNPSASLVTVRCFPWSYKDKLLLIGDAAHAIVPFYGQGMNCGFEDCTVLNDLMEQFGDDRLKLFKEFEKSRKPNSDAIADLAVANFIEMRDLVTHPDFILQKKIEAWFHKKHPDKWLPLYSMVTFSDIPYSHALKQGRLQDKIMQQVLSIPEIGNKWNSEEVENKLLELVEKTKGESVRI